MDWREGYTERYRFFCFFLLFLLLFVLASSPGRRTPAWLPGWSKFRGDLNPNLGFSSLFLISALSFWSPPPSYWSRDLTLSLSAWLPGWSKFRGGLNVKTDQTGTHSYYTTCGACEIMFHVAPLLPHFEADEQQVEKKRYEGFIFILILLYYFRLQWEE